MSQAFLGIYTADGSRQLADWSLFVRSCHVTNGKHGYDSLTADIDIPFFEAFTYYNNYGPLRIVAAIGPWRIFEGRIDDPTQFVSTQKNESGLKITAFGAWVAFSDIEGGYTALWSTTHVDKFVAVRSEDAAGYEPARYKIDNNNRLYIAIEKNATSDGTHIGAITFETPNGGSRTIVGVSFDYELKVPAANWRGDMATTNRAFGAGATIWSLVPGGAGTYVGSVNTTFTGADRILFELWFTTGGAYAGENGDTYLKITNFRCVTSNANRLNTTLGTTIAAGVRTPTPGSMTGIYVGQRLTIGGANTESVLVTAITSTTFTATFAFAHNNTDSVTALSVYPDEIIKDCLSTIAALNPSQISASTAAIQSQRVDMLESLYEDATPGNVVTDIVDNGGDNQTLPRQWVALIYEDRQLIVRPRGSGRAWYIDAESLEVQRSLGQLWNSVVVTYRDSIGRKIRGTGTDTASVARYGITRRRNVQADTTENIQAARYRDVLLVGARDPVPRVRFPINAIYDSRGNWHPLWMLRADDTITIRNFPPTIGTLYDKIRTLVVARVTYDLMQPDAPLDAELEIPLPNINVQLARSLKRG